MSAPRLRMVAGPNGSGKTTLLNGLSGKFSLGHILNPDVVEKQLSVQGMLDWTLWNITPSEAELRSFMRDHPLGSRSGEPALTIRNNVLQVDAAAVGGYFAAMLADFIRRQWLATGQSFTFETVMSGKDKMDLLREARGRGFRTYLYYICTESPLLNRERVAVRVKQGGHDVPAGKIDGRYARSLSQLKNAVTLCNRAYIFDNSGAEYRLVAEFMDAKLMQAATDLPRWFVEHYLNG